MELEYPDINLRGSGLMSNEDQRFSGRQGSSRFSGGEYSCKANNQHSYALNAGKRLEPQFELHHQARMQL